MKEIYQDVKGPFGNCLSACIASILEIDLEFIPNFNLDENNIPDPNNWRERFVDYLNSIEMTFIEIQVYHCEERLLPDCHNILSGPVIGRSKDEVWHSVVGWKTRIIHDPNPEPIEDFYWKETTAIYLIPKNPEFYHTMSMSICM